MKFLRIFGVWILIILVLFAARHFKNDGISYCGVAVAQDAGGEDEFYFDAQMPNFSSSQEQVKEKKAKNKTGEKESVTVNVNTAGIKELILLPGIGEATAQRITDYRKENGNFTELDDLKKVKGIGGKKFESLKNRLEL